VLNYGHSGVGSLQQLAAEWLAVKAGIKMQGIAYRGTGPAIIELMGGRIDLVVTADLIQYRRPVVQLLGHNVDNGPFPLSAAAHAQEPRARGRWPLASST
jgi:hypothetical protein